MRVYTRLLDTREYSQRFTYWFPFFEVANLGVESSSVDLKKVQETLVLLTPRSPYARGILLCVKKSNGRVTTYIPKTEEVDNN